MSKDNALRKILSLLGLGLGIYLLTLVLKNEVLNYYGIGAAILIMLFSIGWFFNARVVRIFTGILFVPVGLAGSLWTIWDFIKDITSGKGVIGTFPLLGPNLTIAFWPYVVVFVFFVWILVMGINLIKEKYY